MKKALNKAQAQRKRNVDLYAQKWETFLNQTSWPKSNREFSNWFKTIDCPLKPKSLKTYLKRHGLASFDSARKIWTVATCKRSLD